VPGNTLIRLPIRYPVKENLAAKEEIEEEKLSRPFFGCERRYVSALLLFSLECGDFRRFGTLFGWFQTMRPCSPQAPAFKRKPKAAKTAALQRKAGFTYRLGG
jgi:hypothetical protein